MSIFNNEEMIRLRDDVQTLQKQVHDLREVLDKVCEHLTPPCTPSPSEAEASPAMVENDSDPKTAPTAEERQTTETAVPQSPLSDGKVADALQVLAGKMESLGEKIDTAAYQEKIIRDMHQELVQLKKGLIEDLKKDYLADILSICERMGDTDRHIQPDAPDYDAQKAKRLVTNTYLYIRDHLADEYSVEYFEPSAGEAYDPKAHRAIRVVETDEIDKGGTVAECIAGGFRNCETNRVLRQARIAVYRKKA